MVRLSTNLGIIFYPLPPFCADIVYESPFAIAYLKLTSPTQQRKLVARQMITTLIGCAATVSPNLHMKQVGVEKYS